MSEPPKLFAGTAATAAGPISPSGRPAESRTAAQNGVILERNQKRDGPSPQ